MEGRERERERRLRHEGKTTPTSIHDRIRLKEHVKNRVHKTQVQTRKQHDPLEQHHPDRPGQHHRHHVSHVLGLQLDRREDVVVSRLLAQALGAPLEDDRAVRLGHGEQRDPRHARDDQAQPESPAPADDGDEAGCDGADQGPEGRGGHEEGHGAAARGRVVVDVGDDAVRSSVFSRPLLPG